MEPSEAELKEHSIVWRKDDLIAFIQLHNKYPLVEHRLESWFTLSISFDAVYIAEHIWSIATEKESWNIGALESMSALMGEGPAKQYLAKKISEWHVQFDHAARLRCAANEPN